MKKITILLMLALIGLSANAQWVQTTCPTYLSDSYSIASDGTNIFVGSSSGIFLSTDNGLSWIAVNSGLTTISVWALAINGTNIFAGTYSGGVFLSTNNGGNWTAINNGLTNLNIRSLAISGSNIFAGTLGGGVFLSTNNVNNWTAVNTGLPISSNIHSLAISGSNVFAGSNGAVYLSSNNGSSWTSVSSGISGGDIMSLAISGTNIFAGAAGGGAIYLSTNNGTSWSYMSSGLNYPDIYSIVLSGTNIFAGRGGVGSIFLSTNNGGNWTTINNGLPNTIAIYSLGIIGTNIFACTSAQGVWVQNLFNFPTCLINNGCYGIGNTVTITVISNGGTPPFQYSKDGGITYQSSNIFTGLIPGTYPIVIKDVNNNVTPTQNQTISQPSALNFSPFIINANCGMSDGQIQAGVFGGTAPYHYLWSNGDTSSTIQNLALASTYSVTVTDANGCTAASSMITVGVQPIYSPTPLCLVTVDSLSTHNIVVWEKTGLPATIDSFRIYR